MFIKVYVSPEEKSEIEKSAKAAKARSLSKYLKDKAFADNHHRATVVELISCMIRLIESEEIDTRVPNDLLEIAQEVLDGQSIAKSREKIAEVCSFESKGSKG